MRRAITRFAFLALPVLGGAGCALAQDGKDDPMRPDGLSPEQVAILSQAAERGIPALAQTVRAHGLPAPRIYSKWYVERLAQRETAAAIEVEWAKREFGRTVVERLAETSEQILKMTQSAERESIASVLVDLADWFRSRAGYGDVLLFHRCQDMATVPIAHLVRDLDFPEAKLDALAGRLLFWEDETKLSTDALNTEAPEPVFVPGPLGYSAWGVSPMERAWARGFRQVVKYRQERGEKDLYDQGRERCSRLPEDLQFYCDDTMPGASEDAYTTLASWDRKEHRRVLVALGSHGPNQIRDFLLFRKKVGRFPTQPPPWWKEGQPIFHTPESAAFDVAWSPFREEHGPNNADDTYVAVETNTFYDRDTGRVKLAVALRGH